MPNSASSRMPGTAASSNIIGNSPSRRFGSSQADVHKRGFLGGRPLVGGLFVLLAFASPAFTLISKRPYADSRRTGSEDDDERRAGDRRIGLYRQLLHFAAARGGPSGPHHRA